MGLAQGGTGSFKSVGFILGSLLGGVLYDYFGLYGPYVLGGALAVVGAAAIAGAFYLGEVYETTPECSNSKTITPLHSGRATPQMESTPPRRAGNYYASTATTAPQQP